MRRTLTIFVAISMIAFAAAAADLSAVVDMDGDGRDDATLEIVAHAGPVAGQATDDVVHSIPTPQGVQTIVWVCEGDQTEGTLFVCDLWDLVMYELDPATGDVLNSFAAVGSGAHGLAWDGQYLIQNEYGAYTAHFTDKNTGMVYYSQPSSGGYGMTWGKWGNPYNDQWLWVADHGTAMIYQDDYYTGNNVFSFPGTGTTVGAAWDGSHVWDSNWVASTVSRYDPNTGALLNTIATPYWNPRDLCWDGHYLWTIHWENQTAYQIDLWLNAQLYPVTCYLNPRYIEKQPGDEITFNASVMNHTDAPVAVDLWMEAHQVGTGETWVGDVAHVTLAPGIMYNVFVTKYVPGCPTTHGMWDLYMKCGDFPEWEFQDGIVVNVVP
ncbi:hypothetical protein AMJ39_01895 [candidate division TA06 bacterium DG_24]|uniref:Next to BRCA1 central domain-containing protein n=3 Tax=Bacteria division TA06 TaxID=1156500 RepID=A0A0S8JJW0_UNCT6|nr:MAG: hypothetical protein AMJ39_01895 [candidate division TA06 bacterium DG_24]KPK70227.1 MAG: hypothetical protein AMJ82_03560 [candidate division TA06 bacterium SM23_40]KPL09666.1 MAG: hypothetical protein AMJ71_05825 [candidate division TA06 bacterium SM1_40]